MRERNACEDAGCAAACCRGSFFSITYPEKKVLEWFPDAQKVGWYKISDQTEKGVYYQRGLIGDARVRIVGDCPNLDSDDNCKIYKNKPADCSYMVVGSKACSDFRRLDQRSSAQFIPVESIISNQ
jgi:Fe-S-cluster containining protein